MIKLENVKVYYNGIKALDVEHLEIPLDKITCILGPNGAGKTTLLKTLMNLTKYDGRVLLNGEILADKPARHIARIFAYASPIQPVGLLNLRVIDALLTSRYTSSSTFFESRRDIEIVLRVAETLHFKNLLERKLETLSSGELQRVILAMAIAKETPILLLDEPDNHIDLGAKAELIIYLEKLSRSRTIIFTTHDIIFGSQLGEYFIVLNRGRIVFNGDRRDLLEKKRILEEVYGTRLMRVSHGDYEFLVPIYKLLNESTKRI